MTKKFVENAPTGKISAASDGSYPVVLISPGQGTSAYYHEEIIREYAPIAFPKGTHVYLDHLKEGQTRTPEKLLGTLVEETVVDDEGNAINRFKPLRKHADWIEEVRPFVGLSVSVSGNGRPGEVNGRQTVIAEELVPDITNTVDLVSYAGRGGRFLESYLEEANGDHFEEERNQPDPQGGSRKENDTDMAISEEDINNLTESVVNAVVAKLTEAAKPEPKGDEEVAADRKAAIEAVRAVESADISEATKTRLLEGIEAGNYDVNEAIEAEKTLREEVRAEVEARFQEEVGASAAGGSNNNDPYAVAGWTGSK